VQQETCQDSAHFAGFLPLECWQASVLVAETQIHRLSAHKTLPVLTFSRRTILVAIGIVTAIATVATTTPFGIGSDWGSTRDKASQWETLLHKNWAFSRLRPKCDSLVQFCGFAIRVAPPTEATNGQRQESDGSYAKTTCCGRISATTPFRDFRSH
jgi:hypothetical protein